MAKKILSKAKLATEDLNRWCVEMAMRWPVIQQRLDYGGVANVYQQQLQLARIENVDADVIGRAKKIRDWVTGTA